MARSPGLALLFCLVVPFSLGASSCKQEPLPDLVYGPVTDPLPDRATLLSNADYDKLASSSRFYHATQSSSASQEKAAAQEEKHHDETIRKYLKANPKVKKPVPREPDQRVVRKNPDGSYSRQIPLNSGDSVTNVTLSIRWMKATIAKSLESFPLRSNQVALYGNFHAALSEKSRQALKLPAPEDLEKDSRAYPVKRIAELNDRIVAYVRRTGPSAAAEAALTGSAPARCIDEEGADSLASDRSGSRDEDPACQPKLTGVYGNFDFPSKPTLTCVKDQAARGSCVSFAIAGALESAYVKSQSRWLNLSEQRLYQQAKLVWFRKDFGDGLPTSSVAYWVQNQDFLVPFEDTYDYNPSKHRRESDTIHRYSRSCDDYSGLCSDSTHQAQIFCTDKGEYRYCGYQAQEKPSHGMKLADFSFVWDAANPELSAQRMIAALQLGKTIVWSFPVTGAFDDGAGQGGFIAYKGPDEGNRGGHATHIVGYIDNATLKAKLPLAPEGQGGGYFIIRNSWSNCWSDAGYVYAPYDYVKAYSKDAFMLGNVTLN